MLPVILGTDGQEAKTMRWTIMNNEGKRDVSIIKTIRSTGEAFNGQVSFTGNKTGESYVVLTAKIGGKDYATDTCKIVITNPERPVTGLSFTEKAIETGFKQTIENPLVFTPSNATYTGVTYTSRNSEIASVNSLGKVTTSITTGETYIVATSISDPNLADSFKVAVKCYKPVEKIELGENGVIEMLFKDIYCPKPIVTPADADLTEVEYSIANPEIASFYQANIVAHKVGETTLTAKARDGQGAEVTVKLIVKEADRTPYAHYQDGTFILNEAWFGHENGDMNFLTADKDIMYRVYERENPGEAFGATSCYGMIYGNKFYVTSKQAADGGDTNPGGGRLVVMDAKTLKKIEGFDQIGGGDGRSLVGVNPDKIYLGTTAGVITFDVKNMKVGNRIEGTQGASLYSGQTGDMVKAGKYVFAIQQSTGTNIIDTETDTLVKCIANTKIQGITQSMDGSVWLASSNTLERLNPATLEIEETLNLPEGVSISCSWGAWRPTPFCASRTKNILYWAASGNMMSGGSGYYRYEIGTDISQVKPFFSVAGLEGSAEGTTQSSYGTTRYDDRTDELIVMTTQNGYGTSYEHNWIHIVDGTTGDLKKTIPLKQYYWFQAMPIFPDKYAPEVVGIESALMIDQYTQDSIVIDLTDKVIDQDNLSCNISSTLKEAGNETVATATINDHSLIIKPKGTGETSIVLAVESNGVVTEKSIQITVTTTDGINDATAGRHIYYDNNTLHVKGYEGWTFTLYNLNGIATQTFKADNANFVKEVHAIPGAYILKGTKGKASTSMKLMF